MCDAIHLTDVDRTVSLPVNYCFVRAPSPVEEVVYQFLLQTAGYPRSAILSDTSVLFPDSDSRPSFVIVDPETARPLAVVHVVGAVDAAGLYAASSTADMNKKILRPVHVQGFVVRMDFKGKTDKQKIQFYRAKDKGELYPLTAANFPDLDSLRVSSKLRDAQLEQMHAETGGSAFAPTSTHEDSMARLSAEEYAALPEEEREILEAREGFVAPVASRDTQAPAKKSRAAIWLGVLLILLAIADAVAVKFLGESLLQLTHVLLIVGAVLAFVLA